MQVLRAGNQAGGDQGDKGEAIQAGRRQPLLRSSLPGSLYTNISKYVSLLLPLLFSLNIFRKSYHMSI